MVWMLDSLSWFLIIAGAGFLLTGGLGVLRMPDFYTRLHAAGMMDTMGAGLLLAGLALQSGFSLISVKLALILLFLIVTSPIAAHALINAAYHAGVAMIGTEDRRSARAPEE